MSYGRVVSYLWGPLYQKYTKNLLTIAILITYANMNIIDIDINFTYEFNIEWNEIVIVFSTTSGLFLRLYIFAHINTFISEQ